jgi:hypothetical protein
VDASERVNGHDRAAGKQSGTDRLESIKLLKGLLRQQLSLEKNASALHWRAWKLNALAPWSASFTLFQRVVKTGEFVYFEGILGPYCRLATRSGLWHTRMKEREAARDERQ